MHIGQRIKELREFHNMSAEDLAKLLGYKSRQSIYEMERKRNIRYSVITKVAAVFNIDIPTLINPGSPLQYVKEEPQQYGEKEIFNKSLERIEKLYSKVLDENEQLKQRITILEKRLDLKIKKNNKSQ